MTGVIVLLIALTAFAIAVAPIAGDAWGKRRAARHRHLPHRPAHGAPLPPGPRHRRDQAHTGSVSAADVIALWDQERTRP